MLKSRVGSAAFYRQGSYVRDFKALIKIIAFVGCGFRERYAT